MLQNSFANNYHYPLCHSTSHAQYLFLYCLPNRVFPATFSSNAHPHVNVIPSNNCDEQKKRWSSEKLQIQLTTQNKTKWFMFVGIDMFSWAPLQDHFSQATWAGLKWVLKRTQNIFMARNKNCISTVIFMEGVDIIKKW